MVDKLVAIEQHAALVGQRAAIRPKRLAQVIDQLLGFGMLRMINQGRVVMNLKLSVAFAPQLGVIVLLDAAGSLLDRLAVLPAKLLLRRGPATH